MGPPAVPATRTTRQPSNPTTAPRVGGPTRSVSGRASIGGAPRPAATGRRPSADSGAGRASADEGEILSPQPRSPALARGNTVEKLTAASSGAPGSSLGGKKALPATTSTTRATASTAAANREIDDLKAKLKVLERKRSEDRDKLKQLEIIQGERDKYEGIVQKLQQKYQPIQQENAELRQMMKEAEDKFNSVEASQAEHESALELATLDREMAEEIAEVLKTEVDELKHKAEELELEVEILKEENSEYNQGMSAEERASTGWLQMEKTNERLREALLRLRDLTSETEEQLKDEVAGLEQELKEANEIKDKFTKAQEKLTQTESVVEDLRQQLDNALGAEDMIEDLTERNMSMSEQIEELKAVIEDLENLKEVNDELEANHVQNEKELQEELDFKDSIIMDQARRAGEREEALDDLEYTLSRFRELVTNLQSDLEDMRASQAVTEGESEKLNDRSRAMMDLNMKLQISAAKAQAKTIDLELRRLEAQEAEQHLEIVKLFLPDTYKEDQDSVLALLRFKRLAFKANLLNGFIKERINGQPEAGHEDDILAGCDAVDKLVWVSKMCDRFVNNISHCSIEQFSKYENALHELEPVERALNGWIDGLRRDELKIQKCADELHRTIALMSHLAEVHIDTTNLANYADDVQMRSLVMQSHLDSAAVAFTTLRDMVQRVVSSSKGSKETKESKEPKEPKSSESSEGGEGSESTETAEPTEASSSAHSEDDELAEYFTKRADAAIQQTRTTKVSVGKTVRALEELKTRSLSLAPETSDIFEQCETTTQQLADLARHIGLGVHELFTKDEGRTEAFTYSEIQDAIAKVVLEVSSSSESDLFSDYLGKIRVANSQMNDLAALTSDLDKAQEFDISPAPWKLRSQELKSLKIVPVDAEEELRRVKEEHQEARRTIAQRDEHLSTAILKIETLESRMRDAQANIERIAALQAELEASGQEVTSLKEDIEKQDRELKDLESERDKWKKIASDSRAYADGADAAGAKAGQERAVATAREMDELKNNIESLQSAVRYLREDNRRARMTEQPKLDWLAEPLKKPASMAEQRKNLVLSEGRDVLGEVVKMVSSANVFDFTSLPKDKLAWKPARETPQYHAAKAREDMMAWQEWQDAILRKRKLLLSRSSSAREAGKLIRSDPAASLQIRLPGSDGKMVRGSGQGVEIVGSREWEALQGRVTGAGA